MSKDFIKCVFCVLFFIGLSATHVSGQGSNEKSYNIREYGAVGDGKTLDTDAINTAIEACSKAGGGKVIVPEGNYLSGTIILKSNIMLLLQENATIAGTTELEQYKGFMDNKEPGLVAKLNLPNGSARNTRWHRALILMDNVENVTITGAGAIDGSNVTDPQGEERIRGPHAIYMGQSKNILISDIRIGRAGNYNLMGSYIENAKFINLTISEGYDGIHVRGGKELTMERCKIYSRDDAIAGGYWENTVIAGCMLNSSCNGVRLIMPASNLEIKDCEIWGPGVFGHRRGKPVNPYITKSLSAIILQPGAWGATTGSLDNIYIHDIRIRDLNTAFMFNLFKGNTASSILVERVKATGIHLTASSVEAWPEESMYSKVKFKDVSIEHVGNGDPANNNITLRPPQNESRMTPSWGWYIRNVNHIEFEHVTLTYTGTEVRPVMIFEKAGNVVFKKLNYKKVPGIEQIKFTEVKSIKGK